MVTKTQQMVTCHPDQTPDTREGSQDAMLHKILSLATSLYLVKMKMMREQEDQIPETTQVWAWGMSCG